MICQRDPQLRRHPDDHVIEDADGSDKARCQCPANLVDRGPVFRLVGQRRRDQKGTSIDDHDDVGHVRAVDNSKPRPAGAFVTFIGGYAPRPMGVEQEERWL